MKPYSCWLDTAPEVRNIEAVSLPGATDVVVIGAGYTGLSAARRLAASGASVLVLERGHLASGASSRNAGQVLTGLPLDSSELLARYGEQRARALFDVFRTAIAFLQQTLMEGSIDCDLERSGHLVAAANRSHFAALRREQELLARVFQHPVAIIEARNQLREIGSTAYHGLLVDESSLGLNPARLALGLARAARRAGAVLVCGVAVRDMVRRSNGWDVITAEGHVAAREVLVATDAYDSGLAPALSRRLVSVGSFAIATEPLNATLATELLPRRRMGFDSRHLLHYFRLTAENRLLFGGRPAFTSATPSRTERATRILRRDLIAIFPQLRGVRLDYAWSGNVAFARDRMPRAGRLKHFWYAAGYAGHGIAMATYLGDQLARRMSGEPVDQPLFDDDWRAIPFYNGRPWFLPFVDTWYRLKDRVC